MKGSRRTADGFRDVYSHSCNSCDAQALHLNGQA